MSTKRVIETDRLTKRFGNYPAVKEVSLNVGQGEIYGFLGLNGAGKTTTIRMLLGMIRPTSGSIRLFGAPILPGKPGPWDRTGYLVELPYSYPELTVRENIEAIRKLRHLRDVSVTDEVIGLLRLEPYEKIPAKNLSLGNNQRLGLAKALIHRPDLLLLDEPANGLDPAGVVEIRELLIRLSRECGTTVFVSSHHLDEISRIATRIGVIHEGSLIREQSSEELSGALLRKLRIGVRDVHHAKGILSAQGWDAETDADGYLIVLQTAAVLPVERINELLVSSGASPFYLNSEEEDLEAYFLRIIGGRR
jgi:ABC-2 type transport system ATP-binding protein